MKKYIMIIVVTSVILIAVTAIAASIVGNRLELVLEASAEDAEDRVESPVEILIKNRKNNDKPMADDFESSADNKMLLAQQPPYIESIRILDADGKDCTVDGGWTNLSEKSRIRATLSSRATRVDFVIAPTGNESYLLQKIIGSSYPTGRTVELSWDVPEDFMSGRLWVVVYNKDLARVSEDIPIISIKAPK